MKSMPITPGITPSSSPSQAAAAGGVNPNAGAGTNAASSDGSNSQGGAAGQNFNDVLARQMAAPEPKAATATATATAAATAAATDATLLKSVAGDKTAEKKDGGTTDATAGPPASVAALMGLPLVPGQVPLATSQPVSSSAGPSSPQSPSLAAQTQLMAPGFQGLPGAADQPAIAAAGGQSAPVTGAPQESFSRSLEQAAAQAASALASIPAGDVAPQSRESHAPDAATTASIQPQGAAQMLMSYAPAAGTGMPQSISSPVGSNRWGDELGQKITWMTTQTDHSAELHLNPPDLGPLKVVLHVSGDQASAFFTSPHAAVREAVSQALPRLRDMLADNGIMLGNTSVSDQGGQGAQNSFAGSSQQYPGSSGNGVIEVSSLQSGTRAATARVSQGLVDTFA